MRKEVKIIMLHSRPFAGTWNCFPPLKCDPLQIEAAPRGTTPNKRELIKLYLTKIRVKALKLAM